jgi:hypothetical protein
VVGASLSLPRLQLASEDDAYLFISGGRPNRAAEDSNFISLISRVRW